MTLRFTLALCLLGATPWVAAQTVATQSPAAPVAPAKSTTEAFLPPTFAGWQLASPQISSNPEKADAPNAAVLQEYGFLESESGVYSRDDNTLTIKALRFADATGAYGAYTFYRRVGMKPITVGKEGSFDGATRILFWNAGVLCDAVFAHVTAMSASDLREMVEQLPILSGGAATPPNLPGYLPHAQLDEDTTRYAVGPAAYTRGGGVLPPDLVDFKRGAEALTAKYSGLGGDGTLTIVNYPTPQIAADRLRAIQAYLQQHDPSAPQALVESSSTSIQTRRSGPLVILTTGNFTADRAKTLAGIVHYDADVTWNNPKGYVSEASKAAKLLLGIASLTVVLLSVTILIGFFFGGGRLLVRRLRGKPATTLEEAEFIKLNLD
jgi:hypothetical protein